MRALGKPCSSSYQCWRAEPVDDQGIPLSLTGKFFPMNPGNFLTDIGFVFLQYTRTVSALGYGRLMKRLEVGQAFNRGGRCRCKFGACQYFVWQSKTTLACEEF
ncbi:unnamed protein product [Anisakis simplex]|uniref:Uncharacterized protein n=1 Tax=Anisakis simplex TaxID=6269 RepID=A0A0M3KF11_ANISI|nr:unnamed protein product [Anisakis simplex]